MVVPELDDPGQDDRCDDPLLLRSGSGSCFAGGAVCVNIRWATWSYQYKLTSSTCICNLDSQTFERLIMTSDCQTVLK